MKHRNVWLLLAATFSIQAMADESLLMPAEDIVARLNSAPTMGFKSMMAKAPDPETRLCDSRLKLPPAIQAPFRNLYVEAAPSADLSVMFEFGKAKLLDEGKRQLDELAKALKDASLRTEKLAIAGHTDGAGTTEFNDKLSCARALAARDYVSKRHGIAADRLIPLGFGMSMLKNSLQPDAAENRRVELRRIPKS